jgi:methylglutaconyl-CoA hydratase
MISRSFSTIELDVAAGVATISLARPQVRNAFNAQMIEELTVAAGQVSERDDIRVVVLRGQGASFSAGADINWMRASLEYDAAENLADARRMSDMFAAIDAIPQAVIGRVHGAALGGGMGLIAVCDIVVSTDTAIFGFTETKVGIIPAVISRFVIPKIGSSWARALYLTGERFDAELAREIGLVHWIVEDAALDDAVGAKTRELSGSGPLAIREAKRLVHDLAGAQGLGVRDLTAERIAGLRAGPEGQEGLRAFLEKRQASWRSNP